MRYAAFFRNFISAAALPGPLAVMAYSPARKGVREG
jgi:hypothetical protein